MGYTHYFAQSRHATEKEWNDITKAFKAFLKAEPQPIQREDNISEPPAIDDESIIFNGIEDDGYETMVLERKGSGFQFCKTARNPYDLAVMCLLLIAHHYAPGCWDVKSDGTRKEWEPAEQALNRLGLGDFKIPELD